MKKKHLHSKKIPVAILGTGNIGSDLLIKIQRSSILECIVFAGKNPDSSGMLRAKELGIPVSAQSIDGVRKLAQNLSIVFDATSAESHAIHAPILEELGLFTIDLTPSRIGYMCVPVLNMTQALKHKNVNMISCGGQSAAPIVHAVLSVHPETTYVELVSSISSRSAGIGTRNNIDEYTQTTCDALRELGGAPKAKAIVILNPANPPIFMHNTIFAVINNPNLKLLQEKVTGMVKKIQRYVPGYRLVLGPIEANNRITIMIEVQGQGDYLPVYAGNLDIITSAAVAVAEAYAVQSRK